jgi:ribosome-associated protein
LKPKKTSSSANSRGLSRRSSSAKADSKPDAKRGSKSAAKPASKKAGPASNKGKLAAKAAAGKASRSSSAGATSGVKLRPPKAKASLLPPAEKAKVTRSPAKAKQLHEARVAAEAAIEAALDKKGLMPVVIDVSGQTTYTDFIGIISGRSDRQVEAIAENVVQALKAIDFRLVGREGSGNGRWTLLDFGDVVIHVFYHPVREFYDIESLWIDAPRLKLKVPPEAMSVGDEALYYDRDPQRAP